VIIIVLIGIVGELGSGKTLSLTFMAYRNYVKGKKIYANYHLGFPSTLVTDVEQINDMHEGFFAGDELWLWLDSRVSGSRKNRFISAILIKSRKRDVQIAFTAQGLHQIDKRIRTILDFVAVPMLDKNETICKLPIYTYPYGTLVKIYKFPTAPFFKLYDTKEEINPIEDV